VAVRTWEPVAPRPDEPEWVRAARELLATEETITAVAEKVGKKTDTLRNWLAPQQSTVATRMAEAIREVEHRRPVYFAAGGWRMDDFKYPEMGPPGAVFVVHHPFRPSLGSCEDMVLEHKRTHKRVVYDEARWAADPRIEEQAGPSVLEDWLMEEQLDQVAA
jgi:hypothetical protein